MAPMRPSRNETEVKLRFDSPRAARDALRRLEAEPAGEREFEDNLVFDTKDLRLKHAGMVLRLRQRGDRRILTLKAPVEGTFRHKVREERETEVADLDEMRAVLEHLGFTPVYRYQKHRTRYHLEGLEACLDETPIGCYVELEGQPASIDRVAGRLGFTPADYVLATYRELQERSAAGGAVPGDMLVSTEDQDPG